MVFHMPTADKVMEIKLITMKVMKNLPMKNFHKKWVCFKNFQKLGRRRLKIYWPNIVIRCTIKPKGKEGTSKENEGNLTDCLVLSQVFLTETQYSIAASQRKKDEFKENTVRSSVLLLGMAPLYIKCWIFIEPEKSSEWKDCTTQLLRVLIWEEWGSNLVSKVHSIIYTIRTPWDKFSHNLSDQFIC